MKDPEQNTSTRDAKEMAQIAARYHKRIQQDEHDPQAPPDDRDLDDILNKIKRKLPEESRRKLTENITEEEVRNAIKNTPNDKAPGLDGIPTELWKSMDDQFAEAENAPAAERKCNIIWVLVQVFQDIENHGMDKTAKLNEGCMSPISLGTKPPVLSQYMLSTW
jgi:hypothetical protein